MDVKNRKRGRPDKTKPGLSREAILTGARVWAFECGNRLTMRGLARYLNVDPMAIYYYFDDKKALLQALTTQWMESLYRPNGQGLWRDELTRLIDSYLKLLTANPSLKETLIAMGADAQPPAEVFRRRFEQATAELRLPPSRQTPALHLLVDYLHGMVLGYQTVGDAIFEASHPTIRFYLEALERMAD